MSSWDPYDLAKERECFMCKKFGPSWGMNVRHEYFCSQECCQQRIDEMHAQHAKNIPVE